MGVSREVKDGICACEALLARLKRQSLSDHEYEAMSGLTQRIEKEAILHQLHCCAVCSETTH